MAEKETGWTVEAALSAAWAIRPLKWKREFQDWRQAYSADVVGGSYAVVRIREDAADTGPWQSWRWEYSFQEYYDEGSAECANPAEGKRLAQEDWIERLLPALRQVESQSDAQKSRRRDAKEPS